jgi:hypothetical protein
LYNEKNGKTHCNTHSQTCDVNEGEDLVSSQIPECSFKIVFDHGYTLLVRQLLTAGNENSKNNPFL